MKLFLFATNHNVQRGSLPPELADETLRFRAEVSSLVKFYSIALLAEELNTECLSTSLQKLQSSILEDLAGDLKIPHLYCEPSLAERNSTGLLNRALSDWRESKWLDKLVSSNQSPIIFVLGADHLDSFKKLANQNHAIETIVLHSDWGSS